MLPVPELGVETLPDEDAGMPVEAEPVELAVAVGPSELENPWLLEADDGLEIIAELVEPEEPVKLEKLVKLEEPKLLGVCDEGPALPLLGVPVKAEFPVEVLDELADEAEGERAVLELVNSLALGFVLALLPEVGGIGSVVLDPLETYVLVELVLALLVEPWRDTALDPLEADVVIVLVPTLPAEPRDVVMD